MEIMPILEAVSFLSDENVFKLLFFLWSQYILENMYMINVVVCFVGVFYGWSILYLKITSLASGQSCGYPDVNEALSKNVG